MYVNKSKWMIGLSIVLISSVCIAGYYGYQAYTTYSLIDKTLKKNEWDKMIKQEEKKYDFKRGLFYKSIVFLDEKNVTYSFELTESKNGKKVTSTALNSDNEGIDDKRVAKYLLD